MTAAERIPTLLGVLMLLTLCAAPCAGRNTPAFGNCEFTDGTPASLSVTFDANPGSAYVLETSSSPGGPWDIVTSPPVEAEGDTLALPFPSDLLEAPFRFFRAVFVRPPLTDFVIETIRSGTLLGSFTSLDIGPDDRPAVAYYEFEALATRTAVRDEDGMAWSVTTVDDALPEWTSVRFAPDGTLCIAFFDGFARDLKFGVFDGMEWSVTTVDSAGDVGNYATLAFGPDDRPAIAYYDATNGDLKFARHDGIAWLLEPVDSAGDVGRYASLAFDPDGRPALAYHDMTNGDLKLARADGIGAWDAVTLDAAGNTGRFTSLAFMPGPDGEPRIAYQDVTNGDLRLASAREGTWHYETVDAAGTVGRYASLKVTDDGQILIAYYDDTNTSLEFARWCDGAWAIQTVDNEGSVGSFASLALLADGGPAISYYDAGTQGVKVALPADSD